MRMKITPDAMQAAIDRLRHTLMRLRAVRDELRMTISIMRLMSPLDTNTAELRHLERRLERIEDMIKTLMETLRELMLIYRHYERENVRKTSRRVYIMPLAGRFTQLNQTMFRGIQLN